MVNFVRTIDWQEHIPERAQKSGKQKRVAGCTLLYNIINEPNAQKFNKLIPLIEAAITSCKPVIKKGVGKFPRLHL